MPPSTFMQASYEFEAFRETCVVLLATFGGSFAC
jgi:hypothetical protein